MKHNFMHLALGSAMTMTLEDDATLVDPASMDDTPEADTAAVSEAMTELSSAEADAATIDQQTDVAAALEDVAAILDTVPVADAGHIALAQTVATMALAGTSGEGDVINTEVITGPAMESYLGRRISTEGFKESARKIWDTIKAFAKRMFAKVEKFFYKYFGRIPRMRKALDAAQAQVNGAEARPQEDKTIELNSSTSQMLIGDVEVKTFPAYYEALKSMTQVVRTVFGTFGESFAKKGEDLQSTIGDFDIDRSDATLSTIVGAFMACVAPKGGSLTGFNGPTPSYAQRADVLSATYSPPLPGNIVMAIRLLSSREGTSAARGAEMAGSIGVVAIFPPKAKEASTTISIPTPAIPQVLDAIANCRMTLDALEAFYRGGNFKKIKEVQAKIMKQGDKISSKVSARKAEDLKAADLPNYRQALNIANVYGRNILRTFTSLSVNVMTSASFVCHVASKTSSAYRKA